MSENSVRSVIELLDADSFEAYMVRQRLNGGYHEICIYAPAMCTINLEIGDLFETSFGLSHVRDINGWYYIHSYRYDRDFPVYLRILLQPITLGSL